MISPEMIQKTLNNESRKKKDIKCLWLKNSNRMMRKVV